LLMPEFQAVLNWIDSQAPRMEALVTQWAMINSGSGNLAGLELMTQSLTREFSVLQHPMIRIALPPREIITNHGTMMTESSAPALSMTARPELPRRVLMGIHFDTVYSLNSSFQQVDKIDCHTLRGPGVADAKGGIAILLIALQALEQSEYGTRIGWEVLLNPDEEIGSPGSGALFSRAARRNNLGLLFEPALSDGSLVSDRKGSGNFVIVIRGRSAHAGRDFHTGRSAIIAAAQLILAFNELNGRWPGATINVGRIEGGGALNAVPDLAIFRVNIRCHLPEHQQEIRSTIKRVVDQAATADGIGVTMHGDFHAPPRVIDQKHQCWLDRVTQCGRELGMSIRWRASGGACDGNRLSAAGLPTIDTLGAVGGGIHSSDEHIELSSLVERAKLTALLLLNIAAGRYGDTFPS
jgi:glutamate carboxypeptidase